MPNYDLVPQKTRQLIGDEQADFMEAVKQRKIDLGYRVYTLTEQNEPLFSPLYSPSCGNCKHVNENDGMFFYCKLITYHPATVGLCYQTVNYYTGICNMHSFFVAVKQATKKYPTINYLSKKNGFLQRIYNFFWY